MHVFRPIFQAGSEFDVLEAPKLISRVQEHLLIENPWILSNKIGKNLI
jgi:hypothetical protein